MDIDEFVEISGSYVGELYEILMGSISDSLEDIKTEYKVNFNHDLCAEFIMIGILNALREWNYSIHKIKRGIAGIKRD